MTEAIRDWVLHLVGTALICSVSLALTPEGGAKKSVRLICGFAMMAAIAGITVKFNISSYSSAISKYRSEAEEITTIAGEKASNKTRFIIEQECEAYILDKAKMYGLNGVTVEVTARWNKDGFWQPESAKLGGEVDDNGKERLSNVIEADLGIAKEAQKWSEKDED